MSVNGKRLKYFYHNGVGFEVWFQDGLVSYQMINPDGSMGSSNADVPYTEAEIKVGVLLIGWHEPDVYDCVTLVIDLDERRIRASGISCYRDPEPMILWHAGDISEIEDV